jgi:hypothetical protein
MRTLARQNACRKGVSRTSQSESVFEAPPIRECYCLLATCSVVAGRSTQDSGDYDASMRYWQYVIGACK